MFYARQKGQRRIKNDLGAPPARGGTPIGGAYDFPVKNRGTPPQWPFFGIFDENGVIWVCSCDRPIMVKGHYSCLLDRTPPKAYWVRHGPGKQNTASAGMGAV